MSDSRLLIGQLAARVGLAPSALRYYEDAGLLSPTERTAAGYRVYGPEVEQRIKFIQRASALGLTLVEIRRLMESAHREADERLILSAAISRKIAETRSQMAELTSRAATGPTLCGPGPCQIGNVVVNGSEIDFIQDPCGKANYGFERFTYTLTGNTLVLTSMQGGGQSNCGLLMAGTYTRIS